MNSMAKDPGGHDMRRSAMTPDLGQVLSRNRAGLIKGAIAGAVLAVLFGMTARPVYEAEAQIYIDPRDLNILGEQLVSPADADNLAQALVESQVMMLGSNTVLDDVINRMNLLEDPEFNGTESTLIGGVIDSVKGLFSSDDATEDDQRRVTYENLRESVDIYRVGDSYVAELRAAARSRDKAETVLRAVLDSFRETTVASRSQVAERASAELDEGVVRLRERADGLQKEIAEYKRAKQISGVGESDVYEKLLADLNAGLVNARVEEAQLTSKLEAAEANGGLSETSPEAMASASLAALSTSLTGIRAKMAELATHATPQHPAYAALLAQEAAVQSQISDELDRILDNLRRRRDSAAREVATLETQIGDLLGRSLDAEQAQVRLREMESALDATWATYSKALSRAEQARTQTNVDISNIRVISEPQAREKRVSPPPTPFLLLFGALGGAVLVFLFAFGREVKTRLTETGASRA